MPGGFIRLGRLMTEIDDLAADQRAVLQLLLKQGQTYEDLSGLLKIDAADLPPSVDGMLGPQAFGVAGFAQSSMAGGGRLVRQVPERFFSLRHCGNHMIELPRRRHIGVDNAARIDQRGEALNARGRQQPSDGVVTSTGPRYPDNRKGACDCGGGT